MRMQTRPSKEGRNGANKMGTDPVNSTNFTGLTALLINGVIIALVNEATDKT